MKTMYVSIFQAFELRGYIAIPQQYRPVEVQLQNTIQGLRDALNSAINEIESLKSQNKALKEKLNPVDNERKQVESQFQEELRKKDDLLKRAIEERWVCVEAHMDCLELLAQKEKDLMRSEEEWKARCEAVEANLQKELAQREESWRRKLQEVENEKNLNHSQV